MRAALAAKLRAAEIKVEKRVAKVTGRANHLLAKAKIDLEEKLEQKKRKHGF
jgi:hypothetical protein